MTSYAENFLSRKVNNLNDIETTNIITGDITADNVEILEDLNVSGEIKKDGHILNTDDIPEGTTNLYFTQARARASISIAETVPDREPLIYNPLTGQITFNATTYDVPEEPDGGGLYFTEARARGSLSAGYGISYNSSTGVITNIAPNYWSRSGDTTFNNTDKVRLNNPLINSPIEVIPIDSKWIYKNYAGDNTEVGIAQLGNYDMSFYSPTNNGSWSYYVYDGTNYTIREKTYYNGDKYLWGSGSFELKNTGSNGSLIKLYNASANGFHLYQDNANNRFRISSKNGSTFTEIFDLNTVGELGLGGLAPRSGYAINLNKGIYINDSAEHLYLEGNNSSDSYKSEFLFNANGTIGTLKHDTAGFNFNRPLSLSSSLSTSGTSLFTGKATFNGGIDTNQGIKLTVADPNKMLYVDYGPVNDKYGFGQYGGGNVRMFSSSAGNAFWSSNNLSTIIDDSINQYVDQVRTQFGKTCILSFQDMLPNDVYGSTGTLKWTYPETSMWGNHASLKVLCQTKQPEYAYLRTFETITQNIGRTASNSVETNEWFQTIRYLSNQGSTEYRTFSTFMGTLYDPTYETEQSNNPYFDTRKPQWYLGMYNSTAGNRFGFRVFYESAGLGGSGGTNFSNIQCPQLARGAYYNAYFDPYGYLYPDVYASDQRLKKNITKQEQPILQEFRKINVVNYNWDYTGEHADFCRQQPRTQTDKEQIGIIAQNLEELPTIKEKYNIVETYQFSNDLPSGRNENPLKESHFKPEKEFLILNKEKIPFLNMKAIQETNERIDHLENENKQLREELLELKLMVSALMGGVSTK